MAHDTLRKLEGDSDGAQSVYTGPLGPSKRCLPGSADDSGLRHFFVSTVSAMRPGGWTALPRPSLRGRAIARPAGALTLADALSISGWDGGPQCPPKSLRYRGFHAGRARPKPVRHRQRSHRQRLRQAGGEDQRPRAGAGQALRRAAARQDRPSSASAWPRARPSTTCWSRPSPPCARRPSARSASATSTCSSWAAWCCTRARSPR